MGNKRQLYFLVLLLIFAALLVGCGPQSTPLDGPTKEAVLAFSEPKTDNLLTSLSNSDYATFSQDFDADMLKAVGETQFETLKKDRSDKLGAYISRQVSSVSQQGDFYVVIYDAKFEKEEHVTMRVVFRIAEPHEVSGLWFNK